MTPSLPTRPRALAWLLTAVLSLLAAVGGVKADDWQNVQILLPAGRMGHSFSLGGTFAGPESLYSYGGVLSSSSAGYSASLSLWAYLDLDREYSLFDESANDSLTLGPLGAYMGGSSYGFDFKTTPWQAIGGVRRVYFLTDAARSGNALILHSMGEADVWFPASFMGNVATGNPDLPWVARFSATYDPGWPWQFVDLTLNQKADANADLAVQGTGWAVNDVSPPEVPIVIWLDPAETGRSFTVWSQAPGGQERFVQVTAQRGSDSGRGTILADGSYHWMPARCAWIQTTLGYRMQFWLTRDLDNAASGGIQHYGQGYAGQPPATWSVRGAFPALPDSARNLQARTFHINGARYGHTFSVVHPDTYQVSVNLGGWGTVWAGDGSSMSYMEGSAQIDGNQPGWYLYDETLQEACTPETTSIFDGWPDFPGAAQNTLSLTIFGWRSGHILKLRQFNAAAQEIRSFDFGTHGWDILPGSLWLEPSDSAPFEVPYFSITMPTDLILGSDPNDPGANRGFLVEDQTVQDFSGFFPVASLGSGAIDLSRWYTPPVEQPYTLSSTRFFHDLVIRCANGEEYPLTDRATQGDISWGAWGDAWWNAWGFFTANGKHRDGFVHWLIDRSTSEILPLGTTSYIADWVSNDTPQNLVASTEGQDSIRITWAPVAGIEGPNSYQVWRKRADWGYWQSMGFSPNGDTAFTDARVAFGVTYTYRVQTAYDHGRSLPSPEVSLANSDPTRDSDQDGIPDWWEFAVIGYHYWGWVNGPAYLALYENGVDPLTVDIDGDGLPDWLEIQLGTSKDNPDSDYDGLSDKWELDHGTDPWIADSDGDGATDGQEAAAGSNPKSTASHPPVLRSVFRNVYYDFYDYPSDSQYPDKGTLEKTASWDPTLNTNEADAPISAPVALTTLSANLAQTAFPATLPALSATGALLTHAQSSVGLGSTVCPHAQITHRRYWLTVAPAVTAPIERTFFIETRRTVNDDVHPPTVRTQTVTIPVGQTASAPFDIITALTVDPEAAVRHYEYMQETLLPVDITVRKKGTTAAPENGLIVTKGDILEIALAPQYFDQGKQFENLITWHYRQMTSDGRFPDAWTAFGDAAKGTKFEHTTTQSGVFRIKATVNGSSDYELLRKRDEVTGTPPTTYGSKKKGDYDAIGVADEQWQIALVNEIRNHYASNLYRTNAALAPAHGWPAYGAGTNKCNIFVAHRIRAAGLNLTAINGTLLNYPPLANEWAGTEDTQILVGSPTYIFNWRLLPSDTPRQPGFVIAAPSDPEGHVGILDYDGRGVQAGTDSGIVNKNFPFLGSKMRKYDIGY